MQNNLDFTDGQYCASGFDSLDKRIIGFHNGDLIVIASRPSMGKTSLALNIALHNAKLEKRVLYYSLDMRKKELSNRLLSAETNIPLQNIRKSDLDDKQLIKVQEAAKTLQSLPLSIEYIKEFSVTKLNRFYTASLKGDNTLPADMIIIDNLQMIESSTNDEQNRTEVVSSIVRELKSLAIELDIPIILLSGVTRAVESRIEKRPKLSDIGESYCIEHLADLILFLYRDDIYRMQEESVKAKEAFAKGSSYKSNFFLKPIEEVEIIIAKHKSGPTGTINLDFHGELATFFQKKVWPIITTYESIDSIETIVDIPEI